MNVSLWTWSATIIGLLAALAADLWFVDRRPHAITVREASWWTAGTVAVSLLFGAGLSLLAGGGAGSQFFAGWVTEYSLSVDNLFVFVVILAKFAVPREHQHRALLIGVLTALVLRGVFIAAGAAAIDRFNWIFYLFGAFLIFTAINLARSDDDEGESDATATAEAPEPAAFKPNPLLRAVRGIVPATEEYHGSRLTVRVGGRRLVTPMLMVILALGTTDLFFALDSIPAIFGLTREPYLVFTANMFALLGLRQLYFLIGGLLERLVYLSTGLSVILGFIGVKMIFEALRGSEVHSVGPVPVPHIGTEFSLAVILAALAVTTLASLRASRRRAAPTAAAPLTTESGS